MALVDWTKRMNIRAVMYGLITSPNTTLTVKFKRFRNLFSFFL
jgi:hypothetical protein